ncbi:hypothetical protein D3C85_788700 [compost metagenome]
MHRAIEVGAQGHMGHAHLVGGIADGFDDGLDRGVADRGIPIADANHPAGGGDALDMGVTEVAGARAGAFDAGMGHQHRTLGHAQHIVDQRTGGVGQVHHHLLFFQAGDHAAAEGGQAALLQAVGGTADLVVEEMGQAGDAKACVIQAVDVLQLAFQRVQALGGEYGGNAVRVGLPGREVVGEVLAAAHQGQLALAAIDGLLEPLALIEGALQQAGPGRAGPALGHDQQGDVVAVGTVAFIVEAAWSLGDGGEHLQADMPLQQARQVAMTEVVAFQQVAVPEQRVVVQVGDEEGLVQGLGIVRGLVGRRRGDGVHLAVEEPRQIEEYPQANDHQQ